MVVLAGESRVVWAYADLAGLAGVRGTDGEYTVAFEQDGVAVSVPVFPNGDEWKFSLDPWRPRMHAVLAGRVRTIVSLEIRRRCDRPFSLLFEGHHRSRDGTIEIRVYDVPPAEEFPMAARLAIEVRAPSVDALSVARDRFVYKGKPARL